jgi:hypothetical protein
MNSSSSTAAMARERERVRRHLVGAERLARARRVVLDPLKTANRLMLLDELGRYRRRGRFPLNHSFRTRAAPEFIDSHGTRCAVAHLMEISGQRELVLYIAKADNNARVGKLARLPELRAWLAGVGLSLAEAARIQPTYCHYTEAEACFCNAGGLTNLAMGTVIAFEPGGVRVRVDRVEGDFPGVSVDDQRSLEGSGELGKQLLFSRESLVENESVQIVATELVIENGTARCQINRDTERRPVTADTVFEALLAERSSCVDVLATDGSAWNQSQCSESESEEGCAIAATAGSSASALDLTSAALFATLIAYRRRRRTAGR